MIEQAIIALMFLSALAYITKSTWQSIFGTKKCASGCGNCKVVDFETMAKTAQKPNDL